MINTKGKEQERQYVLDRYYQKSSKRDPKLIREKRVIGYYGSVGRKQLFDFYDETEKK